MCVRVGVIFLHTVSQRFQTRLTCEKLFQDTTTGDRQRSRSPRSSVREQPAATGPLDLSREPRCPSASQSTQRDALPSSGPPLPEAPAPVPRHQPPGGPLQPQPAPGVGAPETCAGGPQARPDLPPAAPCGCQPALLWPGKKYSTFQKKS